jgi:hypothetical protein
MINTMKIVEELIKKYLAIVPGLLKESIPIAKQEKTNRHSRREEIAFFIPGII